MLRRALMLAMALKALAAAPPALAARPVLPPSVEVPELPPGSVARPMSFVRMVAKLSRGQDWGVLSAGLLCVPNQRLTWRGGVMDVKTEDFDDVFREELSNAGFKVEGDPSNLFETTSSGSDYAVAGLITGIDAHFCMPLAGYGGAQIKGTVIMSVEWQVYSRLQKRLIAKVKTTGGFETKQSQLGNYQTTLDGAFAENVKGLAASEDFRKAFIGPPADPNERIQASAGDFISLSGSATATGRPIGDVVGSVVAVFTGDGMGSGFLVSAEGHILTNWHVVQDQKQVKIRWSDGFETLATVLRTDKRRDIAVLQASPHGRAPLALRKPLAQPGETVFAIGSPLDPKYQGTITRGIVSAHRIQDGFNFIQSDVTVNHGNSGGPLLDEKGQVIGVTDLGYQPDGVPTGINLFIPIGDALDFLSLKLAP